MEKKCKIELGKNDHEYFGESRKSRDIRGPFSKNRQSTSPPAHKSHRTADSDSDSDSDFKDDDIAIRNIVCEVYFLSKSRVLMGCR